MVTSTDVLKTVGELGVFRLDESGSDENTEEDSSAFDCD